MLITQAGEIWADGIRNRSTLTAAQQEKVLTELRKIAQMLQEPSLEFAANKLLYLFEHGAPTSINIMGTMGCGKNSLGRGLATALGFEYHDADLFHTKEAKAKMFKGIPLTTEDRVPFLIKVKDWLQQDKKITSCSALTPVYRAFISGGERELLTNPAASATPWTPAPCNRGVLFLHLDKPYEVALEELDYAHKFEPRHLGDGTPHYINVTKENSSLLKSQYDLMQATPIMPWEAVVVRTEDYRIPVPQGLKRPTSYDASKMLKETLAKLGVVLRD